MTTLMNSFSNSPSESIAKITKAWKETIAVYRLFNNKNITADKILLSLKQYKMLHYMGSKKFKTSQ